MFYAQSTGTVISGRKRSTKHLRDGVDRSVHGLFPLHREVFHLNLTEPLPPGDGIAQLVERPTEKPGAILRRVRTSGAARDFSPSQLPVQTLLRCPHSPGVKSHASISMRTLKIPNTGSHTIVWTHENTTHTDRNGYRCSCYGALPN